MFELCTLRHNAIMEIQFAIVWMPLGLPPRLIDISSKDFSTNKSLRARHTLRPLSHSHAQTAPFVGSPLLAGAWTPATHSGKPQASATKLP
jgi:predicted lysophospholipase L1 biosynthesis ABC-type transport system permease subunit